MSFGLAVSSAVMCLAASCSGLVRREHADQDGRDVLGLVRRLEAVAVLACRLNLGNVLLKLPARPSGLAI